MEINKPMTTRNMLASTLTDYKKPVKLPKITVELDPMLKKRFKAEAVRRGTTIRDMLTAWTFLMRQGRREFPLGLRTVLACLAFAEREGAVPELPADWWVRINRRYR